MKTKLLLFCLTITLVSTTARSQSLEESINAAYQRFDTANSIADMTAAVNLFDQSINSWSGEWITYYYAAYTRAVISYKEPDKKKKDLILDEADKHMEKVKALHPDNDETFVLAAMLANARLAVDGQNRWKEYGEVFNKFLEQAKAINPDNPRIYYLKGSSVFYTPKMFGGGKKRAKPYFEKARDLFAKADKSSLFKPYWGEKQNTYFLGECEKK